MFEVARVVRLGADEALREDVPEDALLLDALDLEFLEAALPDALEDD